MPRHEPCHRQQRHRGRRGRPGGRAARLLACRDQRDAIGRPGRRGRPPPGRVALRMRDGPGPDCLVSGGEPVVKLVEAARRGLGGRNQQLVLAALVLAAVAKLQVKDLGAARTWHRCTAASSCFPAGPTARTARPTPPGPSSTPKSLPPREPAAFDPRRLPGPQRRLPLFRAPRGPPQDRSDAHQRLRPAGDSGGPRCTLGYASDEALRGY